MAVVYLYIDANADPRPDKQIENRRFGQIAQGRARRNGGYAESFSNGRQAIDAIAQYDRIERLVILGHGSPWSLGWLMRGSGGGLHITTRGGSWRRVSKFAETLGPRLAPGCVIGLASCTNGMNPQEFERMREWRRNLDRRDNIQWNLASQFTNTGVGSFAYILRDKLLEHGATGIEVRAHMWRGRALTNPHLIVFLPRIGSQGVILARSLMGDPPVGSDNDIWAWMQRWRREWNGSRASDWILGGPLPDNVTLQTTPSEVASHLAGPDSQIIPSQRADSLEDSEVHSVSPDQEHGRVSGSLPPKDVLLAQLRAWAAAQEVSLTQESS